MPFDEAFAAPPAPAANAVRVGGHERQDLSAGWWAAPCEPDACAAPSATEGLDWVAATVPGTAAAALRDAGRWAVGDGRDFDAEDWWFRTSFEAPAAAPGEQVLLRLDAVATVHEVFLNGELIGAGDSMFAAATIDLGERFREGENELAIRCLALQGQLGRRRKPRAHWRAQLADNRLRFFRTMLLGRCRGFAPGPATVGPWRPVWIERRRGLVVDGFSLRPRCEGDAGVLAVQVRGHMLDGAEVSGADLVLTGPDQTRTALRATPGADGGFELRGEARVEGVERWWPHTHGDPALYRASLRVLTGAGEIEIDAGRVGFRELSAGPDPGHEVERDGIDLHLNGVATFVRGAVWTPVDFVGMAPGEDELRAALEQVRDAGMNMVRIPGTSTYESAAFHDLCDELGILVWQDFAFANFDYPTADEEFVTEVAAEVAGTLAAIAHRPSLAILCGNCEVEQQAAMLGLDPALGRNDLFREWLPAAIERAGVDVPYLPSSPCGGEPSFRPDRGVSNYFGVSGYRRPLTDARLSGVRFAAECLAFANVPEPSGIEAIAPGVVDLFVHEARWKARVPRDAGAGWDFDDVRDHYLRDLFAIDPPALRSYDHERYLELSRAVSGEVMCAVFGEWRRAASCCGGGLVLWLRDLVPGAGWGLVDSSGTPKRVYHALARALAPTAVWLSDEGLGGVGVHVANDGPVPLAATLRVALYAAGERQVEEVREDLRLDAHSTIGRDLEAMSGHFVDASWAYRFGPPTADLIVASLEDGETGEGPPISQSVFFPGGRPSAAEPRERLGLEASAHRDGDDVVVDLQGRRFLWGLCLAVPDLTAEDIGFAIEPGRRRRVRLRGTERGEPASSVAVTALNLAGRVTVPIDG